MFFQLKKKEKKKKKEREGEREESLSSQPSTTIQSFINSDSLSEVQVAQLHRVFFLFLGTGRSQTSLNPKQNGATSFSVCSC